MDEREPNQYPVGEIASHRLDIDDLAFCRFASVRM
jgi:hypothetical protein